jgi:hypothetical protein
MSSSEAVVRLALAPEAALQHCVRALTERRFKDITTGQGFVAARKREFGQWTAGDITLRVIPDGHGSRITITATAHAQSLAGLAFSPSKRMVAEIERVLPEIATDTYAPQPRSRLVSGISAGGWYASGALVCVLLTVNLAIAGSPVLASIVALCAVGCTWRWYTLARRY